MQNRRAFIKQTTAFGAVLAAAPSITLGQGQRVFKFALVGCGGRGSGAAREITAAATRLGHKAVMVGAADFFKEKAAAACRANGCDEKFAFSGADGYLKLMESEAEIVLLCAPPIFRARHAGPTAATRNSRSAERTGI